MKNNLKMILMFMLFSFLYPQISNGTEYKWYNISIRCELRGDVLDLSSSRRSLPIHLRHNTIVEVIAEPSQAGGNTYDFTKYSYHQHVYDDKSPMPNMITRTFSPSEEIKQLQHEIGGLNSSQLTSRLQITGGVGAKLYHDFSYIYALKLYKSLLQKMGATNIPDFATDRPYISKPLGPIAELGIQPGNGNGLFVRDHTSYSSIQIHYPRDKHNGLAYHIYHNCRYRSW
ncbi:MAG: hypothetical protein KDD34_00330 [Bdellovibrionales bacterium]|nr:hypothetical protein [Bdellovibrionales bacterium]